ncbi:hypothetical protein C8F04DRAFT_1269285 [Mycena alexandri]|uniref:BTB domain-containing protein n=1 Tax=Mycena alexandri TaxID=1745969 RepID=A0AAD6WU49_9AGAR|nr:hypothetical protein C8F04DRAFT_1269285 [Mycena alexandri]
MANNTVIPSTKISIIPERNRGKPWFDDGNVILMSNDRFEPMAFRVYKGMVAQHSPMLRAKLENGVTDVVYGCPAVQMDDCTAADLCNFLTFVHGCERSLQLNSKHDFATLIGVLRIATKYKADALRKRALRPLERIYPPELSEWDDNFESHSMIWHLDPVAVINVARELSALSILPAAMAFLANSTLAQEAFGASILQTQPLRFAPGLLSGFDLKGFTLMKEYNHTSISKTLHFIREQAKERHGSCQRLDGCATKFTAAFIALCVAAATSEGPAGYPSFVITVQGVLQREEFCGSCQDRVELGLQRRRRAWWRGLPGALGFSGWDDARLR